MSDLTRIDTIVAAVTARLEGRGASPDDARELAESRRNNLVVDSEGAVCVITHEGRVHRPTVGAVDYLLAGITGNAPSGIFARRRPSDEAIETKRRSMGGIF